jgi:hypothetical protein
LGVDVVVDVGLEVEVRLVGGGLEDWIGCSEIGFGGLRGGDEADQLLLHLNDGFEGRSKEEKIPREANWEEITSKQNGRREKRRNEREKRRRGDTS